MRFPLTIAWLDNELQVVEVRRIASRRITLPRRRARHVLECAADADLRVGDRLTPIEGERR
jgi:uncharacterized membrane protein (UPF0127 family)